MGSHDETKRKIFKKPTSADLSFRELKSYLESLGFEYSTGKGSRRRFYHEATGTVIATHEPHGKNAVCKDAVDDIRRKLTDMSATDDGEGERSNEKDRRSKA